MIQGERKRKKKKSTNDYPVPSCDDSWSKRYEIEQDLNALCRADAVKADPARMDLCRKMAKEKLDESKRKKEEAQAMIEMAAGA